MSDHKKTFSADSALLILFSVSLALNVYLGLKFAHPATVAEPLQIGAKIPEISVRMGRTETGTLQLLHNQKPTFLYIFRPDCEWCGRNWDNVLFLHKQIGEKYTFIGLSLDDAGLDEYVRSNKIDFPVYAATSRQSLAGLRITGTPQTLLVSNSNVLRKNWSGAYGGKLQTEVEEEFGLRLPGLRDTPPTPIGISTGGTPNKGSTVVAH